MPTHKQEHIAACRVGVLSVVSWAEGLAVYHPIDIGASGVAGEDDQSSLPSHPPSDAWNGWLNVELGREPAVQLLGRVPHGVGQVHSGWLGTSITRIQAKSRCRSGSETNP